MMSETASFYHLFAGSGADWQIPLAEYVAALRGTRWLGTLCVGIIGEERFEASSAVGRYALPNCYVCTGEEGQWEQFTLDLVRDHARRNTGAVMYAHSKGASDPCQLNDRWRRTMTARVVARWEANLVALENADVVGYDWRGDHFSGNFWIANCAYLRRLPPCGQTSRYDAERWVGLNTPRVVDVREARGHFLVPG